MDAIIQAAIPGSILWLVSKDPGHDQPAYQHAFNTWVGSKTLPVIWSDRRVAVICTV